MAKIKRAPDVTLAEEVEGILASLPAAPSAEVAAMHVIAHLLGAQIRMQDRVITLLECMESAQKMQNPQPATYPPQESPRNPQGVPATTQGDKGRLPGPRSAGRGEA